MTTDAKQERRLVDWSAGCIILSLVPGDERVALVYNLRSDEIQVVPKEFLKRAWYKRALKEERENDAVVWFIQPDGYGSPFGKQELEDGQDDMKCVRTAMRETLEETGASVEDRVVMPAISYRETPNRWSAYFNIVFAVNGLGFTFERKTIQDEFVDPERSGMWPLRALPIPRRQRPKPETERRRRRRDEDEEDEKPDPDKLLEKQIPEKREAGIYQATLRRIIAVLLQLKPEHLTAMGRPDAKDAEDLVWAVVNQIPYRNFFSPRMLKMLQGMNRLDIAVERLKRDRGVISNGELAASIGANLILWLPYKPNEAESLLNQMLQALVERCANDIRHDVSEFLLDRLERRGKVYLASTDKDAGLAESDEKLVVTEEDELDHPSDVP